MKAATIKSLKDELAHKSETELKELCLQLARFKIENKELLTYLLFESHNEEQYRENCRLFIDTEFNQIDTKNTYYVRKKIRKILSSSKKLKNYNPFFKKSTRLQNIFQTQFKMAKNAIHKLHEDLQYDYQLELDNLVDDE